MTVYKFLRSGGVAPFSGTPWPLPAAGEPGDWVATDGPLLQCENAVHVCRPDDLPYWLDDELWEAEIDGETADVRHQQLARRARLVRRVSGWDEDAAYDYGVAAMVRAREIGSAALRHAGLDEAADALESASEPAAVRDAGHAGSRAAKDAGADLAARVSYAAGTAGWHMAVPRSEPRWVSYPAFAAYSACVCADTLDPVHGYDAERARQASWLVERLELSH